MAMLKDSLITGDLRVTGTIYGLVDKVNDVVDYNDGKPTKFGYSTSGMTSASWIGAWDASTSGEYRLRAISPQNLRNTMGLGNTTGALPVANGGTGQTTAAGIFNVVRDNGGNSTWVNVSGDTMTGALNFANNTYNKMGDDAQIGDQNQAGRIAIKGINGNTGIYFAPYSGSTAQSFTIDGAGTATLTGSLSTTNLTLTNTTDATSSTAAGMKTAGGLAVAKKIWLGSGLGASSTNNNSSHLIISSSDTGAGGNVALELWRGTNASWQIGNEGGNLHFRTNYTTAKQTTYSVDAVYIAYNSGNTTIKGTVTAPTFIGALTGTATNANNLLQNTRMDYNWNGINYFNISAANQSAAKVNDTPFSTATWTHILRFNHANAAGYYTDLAVPFNANSLYYKRVANGALQNSSTNGGWVKIFDELQTIPIANGGTGQTTAAGIFNVVRDNGGNSAWVNVTGDTMSGDLLFSNPGATATRQIRFQCADNDYGRIAVAGTASNSGYMEIATADDANEPIYVRQYSGVYSTLNTTLTLLDASHNTTIPGRLTMSGGQPINQILTGSGTAATTSGSNYVPAKWTFNTGRAVVDGDIFTIKIPVAGHDYGVFMSVNNGTNYYPVVVSGTGRVTTHYPVNNYIQVVFESAGSAASMFPLAGGTSRVTVTGGVFRVINYYDSGNSGLYQNYNPKAFKIGATATTAYDLLAEDATGLIVPAHKVAHRVGSPIYIASSAKAANATGTWWDMYQRHYSMLIRKDGTNLATTAYNPIYLKGTIANGMFTPDTTTPYVFTKAGCNVTGAYYMFVGDAQTSASYINYNDSHPYYYYDGSNLLLYTEYATVASKLATARSLKTKLDSTTAVTFDGSAAQDAIPVTGTLPIGNGGTGLTASPSMLTNLASTTAANVLQASPRPGVTGTLPVGNGGTGNTTGTATYATTTADTTNALYPVGVTSGATTTLKRDISITMTGGAITATGLIYSDTQLQAGSAEKTSETQVKVASAAGTLYMYAQGSSTGNRGLYVLAHGTGAAKGIIAIDTNNVASFNGNASTATKLASSGTTSQFWRGDNTWASLTFMGCDYANVVETYDTGLTQAGATHTIENDGWLRITTTNAHRTFKIDGVQIPRDADTKNLYPVKAGQVFTSVTYYGFGNSTDGNMVYTIYGVKR